MTKTYESKVAATVHETMSEAYGLGLIDKKTMREFDESCLVEIEPMPASQIIALRRREEVSQSVLARYMNVAAKLVGEWERGEKKPSGPSIKLLLLIKKHGIDAIA